MSYKSWSEQEVNFLKDNYGELSAFEIADYLGRGTYSIYHQVKGLGICNSRWENLRDYSLLSDAQKGWIAGILDGEGWIGCDKRSRRITIQVNNTDTKMLDTLQFLCGGHRYHGRPANGNWKEQHVWVLSRRENVLNLLNSVYPYLITKRTAANRAFNHIGCKPPVSC